MDCHEESVLNKMTERHPAWAILALIIMHKRRFGLTVVSGGIAAVATATTKAIGWW
jgi:hypothetical protein